MATEQGTVTRIGPGIAWVKTSRSGACETCASRGACHTAESGKEMEVEALNTIGARVNDRVVISFDSASLIKISFLLYVFPILCMIAGAVIGQRLAPRLGLDGALASVVGGILFFALAFCLIKSQEKRLAGKQDYRPKVVRILMPR